MVEQRSTDPVVWSCGGGTQSAAIAALIVACEIPKPDAAVIADTGREASETWRYYERTLRPALADMGVNLVRLHHDWATVDLFSGEDGKTVLMPMFTDQNGKTGQIPKYCSNEWKTRPVDRYIKSLGLKGGSIWIGFSVDEFHRCRSHDASAKWNPAYPLIERRMSRGDCVALVKRIGWPTPPRSACWMCPYRSDAEWLHLKRTDPIDFETAIRLEYRVREVDPNLYLHRSCKPLFAADFGEAQGDLLDQCGSGMCFT
jgi:hypothetical protein